MIIRFLFGDDIFISYSRRDGAKYAAALANELSGPRYEFSCFLDQWGATSADKLSSPVLRALKRSTVMVLVGTVGAVNSPMVKEEVERFSRKQWGRARRPVIPLSVNNAIDELSWAALIGLHRTPEAADACVDGIPSESVVRLIANSFSFTKRNQRVRRTFIVAVLLLSGLAALSVSAGLRARQAQGDEKNQELKANAATAEAKKQQLLARDSAVRALQEETRANEATRVARRQEASAKANALRADQEAQAARESARQAEERGKTAKSQEIASLSKANLPLDLELSVLLASEAFQIGNTPEAQDALRESLGRSPLRRVVHGHSGDVRQITFSKDGKWAITAGNDRSAILWDTIGWKPRARVNHRGAVSNALFSHDNRWFVTAGDDGVAVVSEVATAREVAVLRGHGESINSVVFSKDDALLVTGSGDGTACVWNTATTEADKSWKLLARMRPPALSDNLPHAPPVYGVDISPDSQIVVTAGADRILRLWKAATGELIGELAGHSDAVRRVRFSHDGRRIVTASLDGTARLWNVAGRMVTMILRHSASVNSAVFSPDDRGILTASTDNTACLWDVDSGRPLMTFQGHTQALNGAEFSPDGKRVLTFGADETARVWELTTGQMLTLLYGHHSPVLTAAFSPDGTQVVTGGGLYAGPFDLGEMTDAPVRVWDVRVWRKPGRLQGHSAVILSAAFSPDDQLILTAGGDQTARVWEALTGKTIAVLKGHNHTIRTARFDDDGSLVVTGSIAITRF
jgi:WD40 repeat protein